MGLSASGTRTHTQCSLITLASASAPRLDAVSLHKVPAAPRSPVQLWGTQKLTISFRLAERAAQNIVPSEEKTKAYRSQTAGPKLVLVFCSPATKRWLVAGDVTFKRGKCLLWRHKGLLVNLKFAKIYSNWTLKSFNCIQAPFLLPSQLSFNFLLHIWIILFKMLHLAIVMLGLLELQTYRLL